MFGVLNDEVLMTDNNIKSVSHNRFDELTDVWEESVKATHTFLSAEEISDLRILVRQKFLYLVELYAFINNNDKIEGFLGIKGSKIEMLFLHPSSRGKGIGRRLSRYAIDKRGITQVDVNEENPLARGFYEHLGFTVVKRSEKDGMGWSHPILHMELQNISHSKNTSNNP